MRTRTPSLGMLIAPVVFGLLSVVLAIGLWTLFKGTTPLKPQGYTFTAKVPDALNLQAGSAVRIAGVDVGRVTEVERDGAGARLTAELDARFAPLRSQAKLTTRTKSLLGEAYVEIAPGDRDAPQIPEGGQLARSRVVAPQNLEDVLSTFHPDVRANLRAVFRDLATAVRGRRVDISDTVGHAGPALSEFDVLATELDRQRHDLRRIIRDGGVVLAEVGSQHAAVQALVSHGNSVLSATAREADSISRLVTLMPAFLGQLEGAGDAVSAAAPELAKAVSTLEPVVPHVEPAATAATDTLPDLRALLRELPPSLRAGRQGLPALTGILKAARPALADIYPALREVVPPLEFLAADPQALVASSANIVAAVNPYIERANGYRQRYARAVPLIWNEIVSGVETALPTHRDNPYPKPGTLGTPGDKQLAWSCDHVNNPPLIPVIPPGTGAPPCLVQGPWEFKGKSAYYPRLLRAAP